MENPIKMDDLGGKPTIFGNIQIDNSCKPKPSIKSDPGGRDVQVFVKRTQWLYQLVRAAKERPILGGGFKYGF